MAVGHILHNNTNDGRIHIHIYYVDGHRSIQGGMSRTKIFGCESSGRSLKRRSKSDLITTRTRKTKETDRQQTQLS